MNFLSVVYIRAPLQGYTKACPSWHTRPSSLARSDETAFCACGIYSGRLLQVTLIFLIEESGRETGK